MNKTININLAGIIFHLDEEAFKKLTGYLQSIKDRLKGDPGQEEIIADIEARVAELFQEKLGKIKEVIGMADVDEVMSIMGNPEDYETDDEEEGENQLEVDGAPLIEDGNQEDNDASPLASDDTQEDE